MKFRNAATSRHARRSYGSLAVPMSFWYLGAPSRRHRRRAARPEA